MGLTSSPSLSLQKFYPSSKVPNIVRFSSPRPAAHREVPLRLPGHTFFLPGRMSAADGRVGAVGGGRGSAFGKGPSTDRVRRALPARLLHWVNVEVMGASPGRSATL